jgi:hypothetical protein
MDCCRCGTENACYRAVVGVRGEGLLGVFCLSCVQETIAGLDDAFRGPHEGCSICDGERAYDLFAVECIVESNDEVDIEYDYSEGIVHFCHTHIGLLAPLDELDAGHTVGESATS